MRIADFQFTESLIWFAENKYLLFNDIPANKILKLNDVCREKWRYNVEALENLM